MNHTSTGALLDIRDVAKILRLSVTTVRELQKDGSLSFYKVGGSVRFTMDDLVAYLERCRVKAIDRDVGTRGT